MVLALFASMVTVAVLRSIIGPDVYGPGVGRPTVWPVRNCLAA